MSAPARLFAIGVLLAGLSACSSNNNTSPTNPTTGTSVSIVSGAAILSTTAFSPSPVTVTRGTVVTWKNNDTTSHDTTADGGMWNSGVIAPGASFSTTLQTAGTFTYHCTIHPGMVGTVTVQ